MARGLAKTIGINLTINFDLPYFSESIRDFWRRWHITLSNWFRDYVYIPLGGRSDYLFSTLKNIFITFLLSGLWHGAGWNYIIWGVYNGVLLITQECYGSAQRKYNFKIGIPKPIRIFLTFHVIVLGWIIFRCSDLRSLGSYLKGIFISPVYTRSFGSTLFKDDTWSDFVTSFVSLLSNTALGGFIYCLLFIGPLVLFQYFQYTRKKMILIQVQDGKQFIYFQF